MSDSRPLKVGIELPIAVPALFAGLRTAAVQVISGAVLAAFIGGGGLGDFITAGIAMMALPQLLVGAIPTHFLDDCGGYLSAQIQSSIIVATEMDAGLEA